MITGAKKTLKICQQGLLFRGAASESEHLVCGWIADAVLANADLRVFIVVLPLDGSGGGDQYSWGNGAVGTYKLLKKIVSVKANHVGKATQAMERVRVAPFCFTKVNFKSEGVDYSWPDVAKSRHAGRFGTTVPTPSLSKYVPAPGNHAKVYLADDTAYYVGSDNLYPHNLAEFGYLVEGEAVGEFVSGYWDQVWKFSESHRVTEESISPRSEEDESAIGVELTMMVSERKGKSKQKDEFAEVFFGDDEDL